MCTASLAQTRCAPCHPGSGPGDSDTGQGDKKGQAERQWQGQKNGVCRQAMPAAQGQHKLITTAQWLEQITQTIVVNLMHQLQKLADLALGKPLARKPIEVVARQIGDQAALVFAKRHGRIDQFDQVIGLQAALRSKVGASSQSRTAA